MVLTDLSDDVLVSNLERFCGNERKLLARIIVYLAEVERRRVHLKVACASMFDFCVSRLEMSEGEAFRRIAASRLIRRFPSLLARIERGEIHLSGLILLREHLTDDNHEELLTAASRKTKRKLQELIAARFPKPDVPSRIRQLPTTSATAISTSTTSTMQPSPSIASPSTTTTTAPPTAAMAAEPFQLTASPSIPAATKRPTGSIEPLSATRYKMELTIDAELRDNVERALRLMAHSNPTRDLAVATKRAFDALLTILERERLGKSRRPQRNPRPAKPEHVTRASRRAVFERDGEQCSYVDKASGKRCPSRTWLEVDHVQPRALGGPSDIANLRVLCSGHNFFSAEQAFGQAHVARQMHLRQRKGAHVTAKSSSRDPSTCASEGREGREGQFRSRLQEEVEARGRVGGGAEHAREPTKNATACMTNAETNAAESSELYERSTSALVNLGFHKQEARRALGVVMSRHGHEPLSSSTIQCVLREALAVLT